MDSYNSYTISNSSSHQYSYSSTHYEFPNYNQYHHQQQEIMTGRKLPPPAHRSAIHSVRKFPGKRFISKKLPIAPIPRTPPKLYKVDQVHFKDAVQKLTGAPGFRQITRLQEVAPPPLSLPPPPAFFQPDSQVSNCGVVISPIDFSLSPSSLAWCWSVLMSPETLAVA